MHILFKTLSIAITCVVLFSCSDSRSPTISNYEAVIKKSVDEEDNFPHCFFRYNFPIAQNGLQLKMSGLKKKLILLSELGLVDYKANSTEDKYNLAKSLHEFTLTTKGKKFYIKDRGICIGKAEFVKIKDVSEPYKERGKTYVRGTYEWTIDLPEWAMEPEFHSSKLFPVELYYFKFKKLLKDENRETHFILTLKDHGWDF